MSALPAGMVTFVFTDIEGSTRLHQRLGPAYAQLIGRHDALLTDVFRAHGGHVMTRMGDGYFVAFPSTDAAVAACLTGQRELSGQSWPDDAAVRVRMGLHCGRTEPVGENYVALAVHQAARVSAAAHGGQVLLSDACARELTDDAAVQVRRLGAFRLKDFDLAETLWQASVPGEEEAFPAPRVPPVEGHNLRVGRTSFVGRDKEIRQLQEALGERPLVTVLGPGGVGKSRLATRVAAESVAAFTDGVRAVSLVPATDEASVVVAIAEALGVTPGASPRAAVLEWLESRSLLLLVDNCEHVLVAAADLIAEILDSCPAVTVLATSREPLRVAGEQRWRIAPLGVPPEGTAPADMLAYDGLRLFLQRAEATDAGFDVDVGQLEHVAAICRLLDGLPLALELAAARIDTQPLAELAARLARGTGLGGTRSTTGMAHHETLHEVVDWSIRLLSDAQRTALVALSLLPAGFTLAGAAGILERADVPGEAVELVGDLVDKSLLQRAADDRLRMLETIRMHCTTTTPPEALHRLRTAVLDWALEATVAAEAVYRSGDLDEWNVLVRAEHDNWVDALRWAAEEGPVDSAIELAESLFNHFYSSGHYREGLALLQALERRVPPQDPRRPGVLRFASTMANFSKEHAIAQAYVDEALGLARASGDVSVLPRVLNLAASFHTDHAEYDQAIPLLSEALAIAESLGDEESAAVVMINLGVAAFYSGDHARAVDMYAAASAQLTRRQRWTDVARAESNLGEVYEAMGDVDEACAHVERAIDISRRTGDPLLITVTCGQLANIVLGRGDTARAAELAGQSLAAARELGQASFVDTAEALVHAVQATPRAEPDAH
jgi:predicted ATPase/class 3 adenylate cyclase